MRIRLFSPAVLYLLYMLLGANFVFGAKVKAAVVVGDNAPELERFAASELCHYLHELFGIEAQPQTKADPHATFTFLIGNNKTNKLVHDFPSVSEQGIVIKSVGDSTVIVGGGSPRATMWAVYELAHHWGVRYLLDRDAIPARSEFQAPKISVQSEPIFEVRAHPTIQDFADSGEAWGIADFRILINQLAKLKFNRLNIFAFAWQPYLAYQVDGIKRTTATLWYGYRYPLTPDMPGRSAFPAGATEFWNPDLVPNGQSDAMLKAGENLQQQLLDYGHSRGMDCVINATVSEYPKEFGPLLGGSVPIHMLNQLTIAPGPETKLDDPGLRKLSSAVVRATIDRYPRADRINISINEWRQWTDQYQNAWNALDKRYRVSEVTSLENVLEASQHRVGYNFTHYTKEQLNKKAADEVKGDLASLHFFDWLVRDSGAVTNSKRPDVNFLYWGFAEELFPILPKVLPAHSEMEVMPDNFLTNLLKRTEVLKSLAGGPIQPIINLTVDDDNIGIVPQITTSSLSKILKILQETHWKGFVARQRFPGDHDTELAYLARAAWDAKADPDKIALEQLSATCGERCGTLLLKTMQSIDAATVVWERDEQHFTAPVPTMLMLHWKPGPMPGFLTENRQNYQTGWDSARKAIEVSTPEGKSYATYWAKRMEFTVRYIDAVMSLHKAANAESAHDQATEIAETTKALSSVRDAMEAYASVARNQTDRGAIAIAAEYAYRPLLKKLNEVRQASSAQ
jgi:hypothetical protein